MTSKDVRHSDRDLTFGEFLYGLLVAPFMKWILDYDDHTGILNYSSIRQLLSHNFGFHWLVPRWRKTCVMCWMQREWKRLSEQERQEALEWRGD